MKFSKKIDRESRRDALKGIAVLSGAAAASVATGTTSAAMTVQADEVQSKPETLGYRETDHIREYYRRARY